MAATPPTPRQQTAPSVTVEFDVPMRLRDGVTLRANIYRPAGEGTWPVLLTRLPYGKDLPLGAAILDPVQVARRGYVVVVQDTRGRFRSEGEWFAFIHEADDGRDAVEWAAGLPGGTGQVGMYGISYFGFTQLAAALKRPEALKAVMPAQTWADALDGVLLRGGALELGTTLNWNLVMTLDSTFRRYAADPDPRAIGMAVARLIRELDALPTTGYGELPVDAFGPLRRVGGEAQLAESITRLGDEEFARRGSVAHAYDQIDVPAYHVGGWYDIFLGGTLRNFAALTARGTAPQKLLIGPWSHGVFGELIGDEDFGFGASAALINGQIDFQSLQLLWFDRWLKGAPNGIEQGAPIKIFVMGENVWRDEWEWPLGRAVLTPYYLRSGGHANTADGDGTLSPAAPGAEPADRYLYDPRDPVPTIGGSTLLHAAYRPGPRDQRSIEARPDVLVYTTPALEGDVEVTGPLSVTLWAASSAPDTDYVARLVDVHPDGRAMTLADGIVRARFRAGVHEPATLIEPGRVYEYHIDLFATSMLFRAGHRIRLEITGGSFPRWDRNPQTGGPLWKETELRSATQTIAHDAAHPSHVVLPIVPR